MSDMKQLGNQELWVRYKDAMDDLCTDPSLSNSRIVNRIEEEIIRRMREAGTKKADVVTA